MGNDEPFRVAAVQMDIQLGAKDDNLARLATFVRRAVGEGARLIVFPECALTGYCFESRAEANELAESMPGPATKVVAELCREHDVHIVFGLVERATENGHDRLYNALALVGPDGIVGGYRKTHLPHLGLDHFSDAGNEPLRTHATPLCTLGMSICYDAAFPEASRVLALAGAELIVLPTNWPPGAEEFARYAINTRALENVVYYLAANRVGLERGFRFIGLSRIVDVHGRSLAEADGESETVLVATIDPRRARTKRIIRVEEKHWIDRFADRRPELYGPLVEPTVATRAS